MWIRCGGRVRTKRRVARGDVCGDEGEGCACESACECGWDESDVQQRLEAVGARRRRHQPPPLRRRRPVHSSVPPDVRTAIVSFSMRWHLTAPSLGATSVRGGIASRACCAGGRSGLEDRRRAPRSLSWTWWSKAPRVRCGPEERRREKCRCPLWSR